MLISLKYIKILKWSSVVPTSKIRAYATVYYGLCSMRNCIFRFG